MFCYTAMAALSSSSLWVLLSALNASSGITELAWYIALSSVSHMTMASHIHSLIFFIWKAEQEFLLQRCGASGLVNCPYASCHNTVQLREKCVQHSIRGFSISTALFSANTQPPSALGCMSPTGIVASTKPCNFYITTSHCPSFLISTPISVFPHFLSYFFSHLILKV